MYHLYDTDYFNLFYLIIIIFVLKFGAWRMSVFATDRRYSDNGTKKCPVHLVSFVKHH